MLKALVAEVFNHAEQRIELGNTRIEFIARSINARLQTGGNGDWVPLIG
ncbi:hypothetical protein PQH03_12190 [Ralstonia insidiosa]|jgi:hypothetical protein|nr:MULTISPECIES: hypothetical protein [Pseudomonadota]MBX3774430.1 hypothetical protein [Ralstonia pickettii]NOZ16700.1 hypothetical protein [Betaproteobacteria bacterium]MBC9963732.1 hypothetical protein [Ralstonia insidiosa]MBX3812173.1 hypothetical protein [Ralstonia pickettii]MBX3818026.1 hypothetical protein [Ralstonia insidiosa]